MSENHDTNTSVLKRLLKRMSFTSLKSKLSKAAPVSNIPEEESSPVSIELFNEKSISSNSRHSFHSANRYSSTYNSLSRSPSALSLKRSSSTLRRRSSVRSFKTVIKTCSNCNLETSAQNLIPASGNFFCRDCVICRNCGKYGPHSLVEDGNFYFLCDLHNQLKITNPNFMICEGCSHMVSEPICERLKFYHFTCFCLFKNWEINIKTFTTPTDISDKIVDSNQEILDFIDLVSKFERKMSESASSTLLKLENLGNYPLAISIIVETELNTFYSLLKLFNPLNKSVSSFLKHFHVIEAAPLFNYISNEKVESLKVSMQELIPLLHSLSRGLLISCLMRSSKLQEMSKSIDGLLNQPIVVDDKPDRPDDREVLEKIGDKLEVGWWDVCDL